MTDYTKTYKGRMTVRFGSSQDTRNGRQNTRVRLWEFDPKPGSTIAKLEGAYLVALSGVDAVIAKRDDSAKSGRFTPRDSIMMSCNLLSMMPCRNSSAVAILLLRRNTRRQLAREN